jgi:uncharacterized phage infection (PIP) family protein YhgE
MKKPMGAWLAWGMLALASAVSAQNAPVQGIYTCVDAQGRKLTSDRPIPECIDREQKVLNPSGTVKQKIGPTLTAAERAAQEAKEKQELEERNRLAEEHRRDKALLSRYPTRASHDKERSEALAQITAVSNAAATRLNELAAQRKKLDDEMEFYKKDTKKAPEYLRRQVEENNQSAAVQKRFIADQDEEVRRVNGRFDDELARLRKLWPTIAK